MALITDKATLRLFIKTAFINNLSNLPDFALAEESYLVPILGETFYQQVLAMAADPAATDAQKAVVEKCRRVIAPLAYLDELATLHVQVTDIGLQTVSSDKMQTAHRWEYQEMKDHLISRGAMATDALLQHLFSTKASWPTWTTSAAYSELSGLLFTTGSEFNRYFSLNQPHRTYWSLRSIIREVEDFYLCSAIGADFYALLKAKAAPTGEEVKAIELAKKAAAQYTIAKAVDKLNVQITDHGFTVLMGSGSADSASSGDSGATGESLAMLKSSCHQSGDAYLLMLKEYLDTKASAQVFAPYYVSSYYVSPSTSKPNPNDSRTSTVSFF